MQDAAKIALKKLGNDSDGAAFELPLDTFKHGPVLQLPKVKSVKPPEAADVADKPVAGAKKPAAGAKKPAAPAKAAPAAAKPAPKA